MKIWDYIAYFFAGFTHYTGRCHRSLFWRIVPVWLGVFTGLTFLSLEFEGALRQIIFWGYLALTLVPLFVLISKRLHDFSFSGFFSLGLIALLFVGGLWLAMAGLILIGCIPSTHGVNAYGDDHRGGNASVFD